MPMSGISLLSDISIEYTQSAGLLVKESETDGHNTSKESVSFTSDSKGGLQDSV